MANILVLKRDKSQEPFEFDKIAQAVSKAYKACKEPISRTLLDELNTFIQQFISAYPNASNQTNNIVDGADLVVEIEDIQNAVECFLMDRNKTVAKAFILYRAEHTSLRNAETMVQFMEDYTSASNAASGSKFDPNSNVTDKNICTLKGELPKKNFIDFNRLRMYNAIKKRYSKKLAKQYLEDLKSHILYKNDETSPATYCVSVTLYPWLRNGMKALGGPSAAPTNLESFCGQFTNLVFAIASQFSGAVATPEWLLYFDYFVRKEFGNDYINHLHKVVRYENKYRTIQDVIDAKFQQVVHTLNQPAAARDYQSVFWNIGYFDKYYFKSMFETFRFPDNSAPQWETLSWLQKHFMKWFNNERTKAVLTFPVETMALLTDGNGDYKDKEWADFTAEMYSEGHSFFTYISDSADSLSSCCRLRNELVDNQFSFSLGAGGVMTGSKSVMTINFNRLIQDAVRDHEHESIEDKTKLIDETIETIVRRVHKYQTAFNDICYDMLKGGLLPVFNAGFIDLKKQYLTIGVNGMVEACEYLGFTISDNDEYKNFIAGRLSLIKRLNKEAKTEKTMFNTEFVPAESLGVKNAKWDKQDGYWVPRDCYNSYFYKVEDDTISLIDKMGMHGAEMVRNLDGGSALHANLDEHLTKEQYRHILNVASERGCNYFTFNIPNGVCESCGYIAKHKFDKCPKCGSEHVTYLTRVIGYLRKVSNFSEARQQEAAKRVYHTPNQAIPSHE